MPNPFAPFDEEEEDEKAAAGSVSPEYQDRANELRLFGGLSAAGSRAGAAIAGVQPEYRSSEALERLAGIVEKRGRQASLDDPQSRESRQARELFASTAAGKSFQSRLGEAFERLPASKLPGWKDLLREDGAALQRVTLDRAERDPASEESRQAQETYLTLARIQNPELSPDMEQAIRSAPAKMIAERFFPLLGTELRQRYQTERDAKMGARQSAEKKRREETQQFVQQEKADKEQAKYFVDGWSLSPDARPSDKETADFRQATAQFGSMKESVEALRALYRQYGTEALPTEARARMGAIARDLQLAAKSPSAYALGVLTGPDLALLEELVPNPASAKANALDFIGSDQTLAKLEQFLTQGESRLRNTARSMGYRQKTSGRSTGAPANAAGRVQVRKGGESLWVLPEDVPAARGDGYEVVR